MVRINLLPVRVSKKKEAGKQQLLLFAVLLLAGLVGNWLWAGGRRAELASLEAKLARTKADIAQLDKIIGEVRDIKDAQKALRDKLDVLDKLKAGRSGPVRMLDELASITPKRLWLRKLDERGGIVNFEGTAVTIDDVSAFMGALKQARYFGNVELRKTQARSDKGFKLVDFTISASVRYQQKVEVADASGKRAGK